MKIFQFFLLVFFITPLAFANDIASIAQLKSAAWLLAQQESSAYVIIDVRTKENYQKGHIPNAVNLPVNQTFTSNNNKGLVGSPGQIQSLFKSIGINNDSHIIVYDDGYFINSARMIWVLQVYGLSNISIIDGGILAWLALGGDTVTDSTKVLAGNFIPTLDPKRLSTQFTMYLAMTNLQTQLVDSRKAIEYVGIESKAKRKGHIPTAKNIPSADNFTMVNGVPQLKSPSELKKLYAGFDINQPIITYCNKGKESALTYLVLGQLGYDVSAYDAGWIEWGNDDSLPIEISNKK